MLSALQLIRLISIPVAMAMFVVAAQMAAGLTMRLADEPVQVAGSR